MAAPAWAESCPAIENSVSLEIVPFGIVQAEALDYDGEIAVLTNACLVYQGWIFSAPLLRADTRQEPTILVAQAVRIQNETGMAQGSVGVLNSDGQNLEFQELTLLLDKSLQLPGLAKANYLVSANTGKLSDGSLKLGPTFMYDRENKAARYSAAGLELQNQKAKLFGLQYLAENIGLNIEQATVQTIVQAGADANNIAVVFGRNAAGSDVLFSAKHALLNDQVWQVQGSNFSVFGFSLLSLSNFHYDPRNPYWFPVLRFDPTNGLGVESVGLSNTSRLQVLFYNLFGTPDAALLISGEQQGTQFQLGQSKSNSRGFGLKLNNLPENDFEYAFEFDTGARLLNPQSSVGAFAELYLGSGQTFSLASSNLRFAFGAGVAAQADYDTGLGRNAARADGFASGSVATESNFSDANFGISFFAKSKFFAYVSGPLYATAVASLKGNFKAEWFSLSFGIDHQQAWGETMFRHHAITNSSILSAGIVFAPTVPEPPLGFSGMQFQSPRLSLQLTYEIWANDWREQYAEVSTAIAFYNGEILKDHFGNSFQTPVFIFRPRILHDFSRDNAQYGEYGAAFTFYSSSLAYTLGAYYLPVSGPVKITFGLAWR